MTEQTGEGALSFLIEEDLAGQRLDKALALLMPEQSRARLQGWIRDGHVRLDGLVQPPKARVEAGCRIEVEPPAAPQDERVLPQAIDFPVLYEDASLLIVDKPAGLTVHPGAGQPDGTLQNALLHYRPALAGVARAGIVHRLDKDTSGLMVIAGTAEAQTALVRAIQERSVRREYLALVWGVPVAGATIDAPLGRHPRDRTRYVVRPGGRDAVTHYRVAEKFERHALLRVRLETGRTHQIRVHMQHAGYPLIGDPAYGRRGDPWRQSLGRQALHACTLSLAHPVSGEEMSWESPLPADLQGVLEGWRDGVD